LGSLLLASLAIIGDADISPAYPDADLAITSAYLRGTDNAAIIHTVHERPFGGTIAHGSLSLSLLAPVSQQSLKVSDAAMSIDYGLDRVLSQRRCPSARGGVAHVRSSR
jgi:hypothetical protein